MKVECYWCGNKFTKDKLHTCAVWIEYANINISKLNFIWHCPKCNSEVTLDKPFCGNCGHKLIPFGNWIIK